MAIQNLNPDEVDAALAVVQRATEDIVAALKAKGFTKADANPSRYGFSVYPVGLTGDLRDKVSKYGLTYSAAMAYVEELQAVVAWSPDLIEVTLGVPEAFGKVAA